jgi:hypothetical protein
VFFALAVQRTQNPIPKAIEQELESDNRLYFQLSLAEALSCTLFELKDRVTDEELALWAAYFAVKGRRQEKEMDRIKRQARR